MNLKAMASSGYKAPILRCQFRFSILSFLLLIILLTCTFILADERFFSLGRPKGCEKINSKSGCQCEKFENTGFEIVCPKPLPMMDRNKIRIYKSSNLGFLEIVCSQMNVKDYSVVPDMSIGDIGFVKMENCPLAGDATIADIFEKLDVTNVRILSLNSSNLDVNLTRLLLNGLQNLKRLYLELRNLPHLPEDLFHDLGNLDTLEIRSQNLELPVNIFQPLKNLSYLRLVDSNLNDLPLGIFRNNHKLFVLHLSGNELRQLTRGTFEGLSNLSRLDLSSNSIKSLEPYNFMFLKNLKEIDLSSNRIKELPKGLFANSPSFEEIYLDDNNLITLPETLFHDQVNLRLLDLSNNRLIQLPENLFQNNKNLKVLQLFRNQLKEITSNIFTPLVSLEELHMNNNHLISIDNNAFVTPIKLKILQLQNNRVKLSEPSIGESYSPFHKLSNLEVLNLRNNSIRCIFSDWRWELLSLKWLDLSYNKISRLNSNDLQYVTRSKLFVNMAHNEISTINLMNLPYVNELNAYQELILDLNDNPLNCNCSLLKFVQFFRRNFANYLNDKIKVLADNLMCQKPENLKNKYVRDVSNKELCALGYEDFENRPCPKNCECSYRTYDFTLIIDCSQGNRTEIPRLPSAKDLNFKATELNISNNNLISLPKTAHAGYSKVTKLILAGNNLSELSIENLPLSLTDLDLRFNKFKLLHESVLNVFKTIRSLKTLYLSENPWQCDCEARPLLHYAQYNILKILDYSEMRCAMPNRGAKFLDLPASDFCPPDKTLVIFWATLAVFFLLIALTATLCILFLKYQIEIKVWLYARNMCLWFVTEEELDKDKIYDAFISYSSKDEDFIVNNLVPNLENGTPAFKICVHYRDFLVGEYINVNIANAVENSRRTIVVLSKNFLESSWARHEFRTAHLAALEERKPKVIVILYGDIGNIDDLDSELKVYLKTNTYLQWNDPLFWERLRYAMPHSKLHTNALTQNPMQSSVDENFELINITPVTTPLTTPPSNTTTNPSIAHLNLGTPQTAIMIGNGQNGDTINSSFIINSNAKESDV